MVYRDKFRTENPDIDGTRVCKVCMERKSIEGNFYKTSKPGFYRRVCNSCVYKKDRARPAEARAEVVLRARVKKDYGLTLEEYYSLIEGRECNSCGRVGNLVVDHDHKTGKIRGVLCSPCNMGIGLLGDDLESLLKAVEYLSQEEK